MARGGRSVQVGVALMQATQGPAPDCDPPMGISPDGGSASGNCRANADEAETHPRTSRTTLQTPRSRFCQLQLFFRGQ